MRQRCAAVPGGRCALGAGVSPRRLACANALVWALDCRRYACAHVHCSVRTGMCDC